MSERTRAPAGSESLEELILDGRLDQAAYRAAALAGAASSSAAAKGASPGAAVADAALLAWLRDADLPRERGAPWRAAYRLGSAQLKDASPRVAAAVRQYLARGLARAAELEGGRGSLCQGEAPGAYLLLAGLASEAAESLFASLAREPASGPLALLLANALFRLERLEEARDLYRRALRVAPLHVELEQIEDEEVRSLVTLARDLGLEGDPRPWLPALGWLEELLPLSALDPVPGAGFGDGSRAYDLLIAHKGARSHGERTAILRDLQALAPTLFAALGAAGKLDPEGGRAGSA